MARTSGRVGAGEFRERLERAELDHGLSGARYRITRDVEGLILEFRRRDSGSGREIQGRRRLDYYIGSGAVGRSYAFLRDGFLFQAPVSYYSTTSRWDVSPGYEARDRLHLSRAVGPECLACHATGTQAVDGTRNRYEQPPFREGGIGCERCHGPGLAHIVAARQDASAARRAIVQPARLDAPRRDSICAQCHL